MEDTGFHSPQAAHTHRATDRPVRALWRGDRDVLGDGWEVKVLACDPLPAEVINGHVLHRLPGRTACWIRYWPEGRDYPMYRSCDRSDLDLSDEDGDALSALSGES